MGLIFQLPHKILLGIKHTQYIRDRSMLPTDVATFQIVFFFNSFSSKIGSNLITFLLVIGMYKDFVSISTTFELNEGLYNFHFWIPLNKNIQLPLAICFVQSIKKPTHIYIHLGTF